MSTNTFRPASPMPLTTINWEKLVRDAFGAGWIAGFIGGTLQTAAEVIDERKGVRPPSVPYVQQPQIEADDEEDDEAIEAAALLGVSVDATDSEIRAALRARLSSSRLHPDHGGDGVEAKRLIAAKNLLIERLRGDA